VSRSGRPPRSDGSDAPPAAVGAPPPRAAALTVPRRTPARSRAPSAQGEATPAGVPSTLAGLGDLKKALERARREAVAREAAAHAAEAEARRDHQLFTRADAAGEKLVVAAR